MKEVLRRSKSVVLFVMVFCWFCVVANAYAEAAPDFNSTKLTGDSQGVEAFYNFKVAKWLHITPDFQIIEPSTKQTDVAYVAGLRVRMDF
jgi:hypothetical protein